MDYYHYAYQCPYETSVGCKDIHCEGGCRIRFQTAKSCKAYLRDYCANEEQTWKQCTIAMAKNRFYEEEYDGWIIIQRQIEKQRTELEQREQSASKSCMKKEDTGRSD